MAENKDKEGSSGSQKKIRWDDEMVYPKMVYVFSALYPKSCRTTLFLSSSKMRAITRQAAASHSDILL